MVSASVNGARRGALVAAALLVAGHAMAATIYGALSEGGQPFAGKSVTLKCGGDSKPATTDARGAYRFTVNQTGKCELKADGAGAAAVILYDEPTRYDYEIRGGNLVRR